MKVIDFQAGDIVISSGHVLMWVGGERPIVHNQGGAGVVRDKADQAFHKLRDPIKHAVFRADDARLGAGAAEYAIGWSVNSNDDNSAPAYISPYDRSNKTYQVGATSASGRYEYASALRAAGRTDWTVQSLYHVVKAVARKYHGRGLSPSHGVTCAQFAVYCYQAACLEQKFGHFINASVLDHLCQDRNSTKYLKLQSLDQANPLKSALKDIQSTDLPLGLRVEPQAVLREKLREKLSEADSGFTLIGYLIHKKGQLRLWAPTDGEKLEDITVEAVKKLF